MSFKAVIFDFDGVITDSEIMHFRAFNKVLGQFNVQLNKKDYYTNYLGLSDIDLFNRLGQEGRLKSDEFDTEELIRQKNQVFERLVNNGGMVIDAVPEFLDMLREKNVRMAICSGALRSEIELILEKAGLRSFFEDIVSAEEVRKGKPDPEGFLLALEKLNDKRSGNIVPGECIAIEDSHWGIDAANAANMYTVAVTNSYSAKKLKAADVIVASLHELDFADLQGLCG